MGPPNRPGLWHCGRRAPPGVVHGPSSFTKWACFRDIGGTSGGHKEDSAGALGQQKGLAQVEALG